MRLTKFVIRLVAKPVLSKASLLAVTIALDRNLTKRYHSAVGGASLHDFAGAKNWLKETYTLESQRRSSLCPSDRLLV
jgi:hypothetical protein